MQEKYKYIYIVDASLPRFLENDPSASSLRAKLGLTIALLISLTIIVELQ
jgi:DNA-directed RNA polymerase subunit H (RpoH/RPB5)